MITGGVALKELDSLNFDTITGEDGIKTRINGKLIEDLSHRMESLHGHNTHTTSTLHAHELSAEQVQFRPEKSTQGHFRGHITWFYFNWRNGEKRDR